MSHWEWPMMRKAGSLLAEVSAILYDAVQPGVTPLELDALAEEEIRKRGATPAFKGYSQGPRPPFPATLCISVNDVVIHGIPDDRPFVPTKHGQVPSQVGDLVSVDMGLIYGGYHADHAWTKQVREESLHDEMNLVKMTKWALEAGIVAAQPGNRIGDIGAAIQSVAEMYQLGIVREYAGHGIGKKLHDTPNVPNFGKPGRGLLLKPGMALAIEPMLTVGDPATVVDDDQWTVRTKDGSLACHFEHTVLITDTGNEVLTAV